MKIFCVIPAFNEEKTIRQVISDVKPLVSSVVVVDDASSDKTYDLAKAEQVIVLRHAVNRGQGAALLTGTDYAISRNADIIVHFDADGQFIAEDINKIIEPIASFSAEIVFGSRFLNKNRTAVKMPFFKYYFIIPLARAFNSVFLKINLSDPQCGFRALSRSAAKKIRWRQDRMAHCSEILSKACRHNLKINEAPVRVIYHDYGQRFSGGVKILKELFIGALTE